MTEVELLWFSDCSNYPAARQMLKEVIEETLPGTPIREIDATDPRVAERVRFPGSPAIRVDGTDVTRPTGSWRLHPTVPSLPDGYRSTRAAGTRLAGQRPSRLDSATLTPA